jgi:hypothetical protein
MRAKRASEDRSAASAFVSRRCTVRLNECLDLQRHRPCPIGRRGAELRRDLRQSARTRRRTRSEGAIDLSNECQRCMPRSRLEGRPLIGRLCHSVWGSHPGFARQATLLGPPRFQLRRVFWPTPRAELVDLSRRSPSVCPGRTTRSSASTTAFAEGVRFTRRQAAPSHDNGIRGHQKPNRVLRANAQAQLRANQ